MGLRKGDWSGVGWENEVRINAKAGELKERDVYAILKEKFG